MPSSRQPKGYNSYCVHAKDAKYLPPYLRDVPETRTPTRCQTGGDWPAWLRGNFLRVGVAQFVIPTSEDGSKPDAVMQHWFDGLGMLHKFHMDGGEIWYSSRYTSEGIAKKAKADGSVKTTFFGNNANEPLKSTQDPCSAVLGSSQSLYVASTPPQPDEVIVNVTPRRGMHLPSNSGSSGDTVANPEHEEIVNHTDWNLLQVCDAKTLEPKRLLTYADIDAGLAGYGICAHPPKDRKRGMTFNYIISEQGSMAIFALNIKSKPTKLVWKTALPCDPCYIHSLAMTDKFVIFVSNPIGIDLKDVNAPIIESLTCKPDAPALFFVLDKESGDMYVPIFRALQVLKADNEASRIASFNSPHAFIFFHAINAYDFFDPGRGTTTIHVDLCSYEGRYLTYGEYNLANFLEPAAPFSNGRLIRYEMIGIESHGVANPGRVTVAASIPGVAGDMPRIAKSASMDPSYRYIYMASEFGGPSPGTDVPLGRLGDGTVVDQAALFSGLAKTDWQDGRVIRWQPQAGESCPCEPIFIQRPDGQQEDDGVVLTIVIDKEGTRSILVALDGRTFKEVARAWMPQVYAMAPHGSFIEA